MEEEGEPNLRHLLKCFIDEIPQTQVFKTKWAMVQTNLLRLQSQLDEVSGSIADPVVLDLVRHVGETLEEGALLASKYRSAEILAGGKLRAQSDVDSVISRLDIHTRDLDFLLQSGNPFELSGSKKLITRLQIGSSDSKNSALDSLLDALHEDDKSATVAVANGAVPALVRALDSPDLAKEKVLAAIARAASVESGRDAVLSEGLGLANHLVRSLESGSSLAREKACATLIVLASSKENARSIGSRGGVSALLDICQSGTPNSQISAAGVLRNVAVFPEVAENFIEENAVPVLISLATSGAALAQQNSLACLRNLLRENDGLKPAVYEEGAIECLKNIWHSNPPLGTLHVAVELIGILAGNPTICERLISDKWVERVGSVLISEAAGARAAAALAIHELGSQSERVRKEMGRMGLVGLLVGLMEGKGDEEREAAVMALSVLVTTAGNRRLLMKEDKAVGLLVGMLDPGIRVDKRYPVWVLGKMLDCKRSRKEMIAAGARAHLRHIEEVEGVKKLAAVIGRGKILGVFSRPG